MGRDALVVEDVEAGGTSGMWLYVFVGRMGLWRLRSIPFAIADQGRVDLWVWPVLSKTLMRH
uniref:Uncharacterized protein n=1 Tax=Arundo donax TaxID=35708 RepID=A0A0A9GY10_ARUDO